jgi:hypothetical protein
LTRLERRFGLSSELGSGVCCSENGVFVGSVPLLKWVSSQSGPDHWHPRPVSELNRDLSECYGLPIEFTPKIGGLTAACRALNRGDLFHAQIAAIHLQIPDPQPLTKTSMNFQETIDLARQLQASGLLKADWDPAKHPRWPAGSPGAIGGEFAPARQCGARRFRGWGARCTDHTGADSVPHAVRASGWNSFSVGNPASASHSEYQSSRPTEKSLS